MVGSDARDEDCGSAHDSWGYTCEWVFALRVCLLCSCLCVCVCALFVYLCVRVRVCVFRRVVPYMCWRLCGLEGRSQLCSTAHGALFSHRSLADGKLLVVVPFAACSQG
jgi:hypothetical protein